MQSKINKLLVLIAFVSSIQTACNKPAEDGPNNTTPGPYLYVAAGQCFTGVGTTTFSATTSSNLVYRIDVNTGRRDSLFVDYRSIAGYVGDSPTGVVDWDADSILVSVANGTTGRIDRVAKRDGSITNFTTNPAPATIFSAAPRGMIKTSDGGLLILKSGAIEKLTSGGTRLPGPAASASYVMNNLGATCGTTNTTYTSVIASPTQSKLITAHAFAGTNRLISLPAVGGNTSCTSALAVPGAGTEWPTAMAYDPDNNKLLVAYASNLITANSNLIVAYDFNETTGAITNAQTIYDISLYPTSYSYILFGISSMYYDSTSRKLYVSTATSTAATVVSYAIEKFSYDATKIGTSNTTVLTRSGTVPWYEYGFDTSCIASMTKGN